MKALNVASLWRLPLLLVCEDNGFSEFSPSSTVTAGDIYKRAEPFNVAAECAASAAPTISPIPPPTMPLAPIMPLAESATCMDPPKPPQLPVARP